MSGAVASGTELERIHRFLRRCEERACDEAVPTCHGVAMLTPSLPLVWQLNAIHVEDRDATPESLAREAQAVQGPLGHRKLVVHDARLGARLSAHLAAGGWNVFRLRVMVWRRGPDRVPAAGAGGEIDRERGAEALAAFRREQPFGSQPEAVGQLAEMDERYGRACEARDFASPPADPACACRLYTDGKIAQVDEVGTLAARRGRGHARAAVLAAVDAARARECAPIFLLTDASDWPQQLYSKLGFEGIGSFYEFLKLPLSGSRP